MPSRSNKRSWWEGFQDSKYPAYATLIHPKIFGITLKKKSRVSQVAVDDVLDAAPENGQWQPKTFELKKGSCVFVLPEDASSADKAAVSEPWMVRINQMWFMAGKGAHQPTVKDDKTVIKWEQQQLQKSRLSVQQFDLEVNYFYRLSDLESVDALAGRHGPKNTKTLCQALVRLGIIETVQAGEELIKKRGRGATKAHRLLSRFVAFSTHEGKLPPDSPNKRRGAAAASSDEEEDDSTDEDEAEADTPIPMESVMGPFKVFCLGAQQRLRYLAAPVAAKAQRGENQELLPSMRRVQKDAVLEEQQQQHRALPHGFFCNLIFCKQEGQLFWLEDWAAGRVGPKTGDWVQASREQAADLLATTRAELEALQQDVSQQQQEPVSSLDGRARGRGKRAAAAADGSEPDSDTGGNDLQHSEQHARPAVLSQRRTPRKRQHPRKAEQEPEQQKQRRRLRSAADAAADLDSPQVSSGDEGDDASDGVPARKKRRGRALQADSTDTGKESSPPSTQVIDSSSDEDEGVREAAEAAPSRAAAAGAAGRHAGAGAQRRSSDVLRSSKASAGLPRRSSKAMQQS